MLFRLTPALRNAVAQRVVQPTKKVALANGPLKAPLNLGK